MGLSFSLGFFYSCLALSCSYFLKSSAKSVCVSVDSGLLDSPWGPGKKGGMDGHKRKKVQQNKTLFLQRGVPWLHFYSKKKSQECSQMKR